MIKIFLLVSNDGAQNYFYYTLFTFYYTFLLLLYYILKRLTATEKTASWKSTGSYSESIVTPINVVKSLSPTIIWY